ncbi:serine threonine- kinase [Brachionus plicatilis]|uniref:Serine threonine-kinase n=1 Tax=Brachionus plicatilis TaxID=10195 RepID=A0A3M7S5P5_BRAPC|nr:serine threonine- kinase [Brachionus plicatilis]
MGNKPSNTERSLGRSVSNLADSTYERKSTRRFKPKSSTIDRSTSSPIIARNNDNRASKLFTTSQENRNQFVQPGYQQVPKIMDPRNSDRSFVINLNSELKQKQQDLTTAIKKLDSTRPTHHISSKLYKPNSLMMATSNQNILSNRDANQSSKCLNSNTLPSKMPNRDHLENQERSLSPRNVRISPKVTLNESNNSNKPKPIAKFAKRLGLSPRFKRKIVETITNRVNTNNSQSNLKQSRLFQALQSQWNIFTSQNNLNKTEFVYEDDSDDESRKSANHFQRKRRVTTASTFLLNSLERNSFRYTSRRRYKTQSLANPFRHGNTNYPVYIHEALFMPEFTVKGRVTEADFEILDVISRGAFGHVIKVKKKPDDENSHDQVYAMKIMWKSQVIRDRALQQVKDEVTIATSCFDNPLIVKTWFYWQSKRFLYIITDYVENGELLSLWLKVHHFPERVVALYAIEMSLALDYLHRKGIIYRDIKMENILLDERGHIQLIDFGLSKWLKLGERTSTICGTIQYMAPEILSVEPYDHSVDWWSLGILVYALISGEYPLNAAKDHIQMNEKVSRHIFELDQSKGKYSLEACDIIRKLLRKNPHKRLKSLKEIKSNSFFLKEVETFTRNRAKVEEKIFENMSLLVNDNFWNPYFIVQNYSPFQLIFDEICAIKNKNQGEKKITRNNSTLKVKASKSKYLSSSSNSSSSNCSPMSSNTPLSVMHPSEIGYDCDKSSEDEIQNQSYLGFTKF